MIACLHLPYFAATIFQQAYPHLGAEPLVIAQYRGGRGKVQAVCTQAEQAEVRVGETLAKARALCPEARIMLAEPSRVRRTIEHLLLTLSQYSQYVEVEKRSVQSATFYLDLGKLRPADGKALAQQMLKQLEEMGFTAAIGLAAGKFPALVAAHTSRPGWIMLVKRGEEPHYLAGFPTALLPMEPETARRLALFGLERIGQLARLPRTALIAQFGKEGERLHRLANGEDGRYVAKYQPPVVESTVRQFETPIENLLILENLLGAMSAELAGRLGKAEQACREVMLTLRLADRTEQESRLRLREQVSAGLDVYRVLQRLLQRLAIRAGVIEIEVRIGRIEALLPRQLSLFDTPGPVEPRAVLIDLAERYEDSDFYRVVPTEYRPYLLEWRFRLEKVEVA